ncbi:hypothetical protein [Nocardia sp. NPDC058705]|uniref:hypothetical protein n=1 Tax=Nocardia sp. NPDC058705 TaxID=3346609 RepID=UPI003695116F
MSGLVGGLLLDGDDLHTVSRLLVMAEQARRRNGLPPTDRLVRLRALVDNALAEQGTQRGRASAAPTYRQVTTAEYARLTGCTERTARRHARQRGAWDRGRWWIPIKE